jgi:hypothetical protein
MKRRSADSSLSGLDLLEEAVHLLRSASPVAFLWYYLGSAPFVLGVLFFWSDMSRSGLAEKHLVPGAVALSLLFIWMKFWQAMFARQLGAGLAGESPAPLRATDIIRVIGSQAFVHSTGLFLIPVAANILLPMHWVFAFYQNATALAFREPGAAGLFQRSWKQACLAPIQGHTALAVLALFGLFIFINVAITILSVPFLMKTILGVETSFTLSVESSFNTTFLASALGVTYLCFDPVIKATYVLRCFYGQSRQSGEDLRVTLRGFRAPAAAALITFLLLCQPFVTLRAAAPEAATPAPAPATGPAAELNRSIDDVLRRPEYTWRSPRVKEENEKKESALWQRVREWARDTARAIRDWFDKVFNRTGRTRVTPPGTFSFSAHGLIYILIAVVLLVIGWLAWLLWRSRSRSINAGTEATPAAPLPDLERDDVAGDELPEDGWTRLALELLERGEFRLAMRAFYLSSLAHLAGRNLVSIAKFKSNRDYERELWRRSHALPDLTHVFSENVSIFDRVWYGMHEINMELVQQFRGNVERIKSC